MDHLEIAVCTEPCLGTGETGSAMTLEACGLGTPPPRTKLKPVQWRVALTHVLTQGCGATGKSLASALSKRKDGEMADG